MTTGGVVMDTRWKVKVLAPQTNNLSKQQRAFLTALVDRLEAEDHIKVIHRDMGTGGRNSARYDEIKDCDGVVILAFEQWKGKRSVGNKGDVAVMPSEFTHIGIVQAGLSERPYLILREKSLSSRGALRNGFADVPLDLPSSLDPKWLRSERFDIQFDRFLKTVQARYHVFLGYSSQAETVADKLLIFLTDRLKLRVYDWHRFAPTKSIWESIEDAERRTNGAIFLFMKDDPIGYGEDKKFMPRDNVIFEAGYFAGAKRKSRALVIREEGAKLPTDFGGILCLELPSRESIAAIETRLTDWIERMLTGAD
jgi:hypothetical protein